MPIWANTGRAGGYAIDTRATLGPMAFTPDEALATLIALSSLRRGPFRQAAASALRKVVAVMPDVDAQPAVAHASRYHFLEPDAPITPYPAEFGEALRANRVLRLEYWDRDGTVSHREVEPLGYIEKEGNWYLIAWCRLRNGIRAFRRNTDRMLSRSTRRLEWFPKNRKGLMPFASIRIITDDVDRLASFYELVIGTTPIRPAPVFAQFSGPGATLAIAAPATVVMLDGAATPASNRSIFIEFEVPDVDAEYARLRDELDDIVLEPSTMPWGNRSALFRDPDGNLVNLFSRPVA